MEVDQIQCKFPKISNGGYASTIVTQREKMDDDEEEGENRRSKPNNGATADPAGGAVGLYGWPSSRIVRVSRATGGKDRHSKVLTSRGLRDRRVRLSVNTAIEFYDLQDRLGYDQPSKAVEWLLAAAATSIAELPPVNPPFLLAHKRPSEEENMSAASQRIDSVMDRGGGSRNRGRGSRNRGGVQKESVAAKSPGVSSSSETSKGSGLSISRSENRFRAREKAKERENENSSYVASFTELLSGSGLNYINGGGGGTGDPVCRDQRSINIDNSDHQSNFFPKFPLDYFSTGLSQPPATASPSQIAAPLLFSAAADHHPQLQPFSFASDNMVSAINRGTLQSNSSSPPPSLHYHPSFFGGAPAGNHRHLLPGFDGRLQLYYGGDGEGNDGRQSGTEGRDKP